MSELPPRVPETNTTPEALPQDGHSEASVAMGGLKGLFQGARDRLQSNRLDRLDSLEDKAGRLESEVESLNAQKNAEVRQNAADEKYTRSRVIGRRFIMDPTLGIDPTVNAKNVNADLKAHKAELKERFGIDLDDKDAKVKPEVLRAKMAEIDGDKKASEKDWQLYEDERALEEYNGANRPTSWREERKVRRASQKRLNNMRRGVAISNAHHIYDIPNEAPRVELPVRRDNVTNEKSQGFNQEIDEYLRRKGLLDDQEAQPDPGVIPLSTDKEFLDKAGEHMTRAERRALHRVAKRTELYDRQSDKNMQHIEELAAGESWRTRRMGRKLNRKMDKLERLQGRANKLRGKLSSEDDVDQQPTDETGVQVSEDTEVINTVESTEQQAAESEVDWVSLKNRFKLFEPEPTYNPFMDPNYVSEPARGKKGQRRDTHDPFHIMNHDTSDEADPDDLGFVARMDRGFADHLRDIPEAAQQLFTDTWLETACVEIADAIREEVRTAKRAQGITDKSDLPAEEFKHLRDAVIEDYLHTRLSERFPDGVPEDLVRNLVIVQSKFNASPEARELIKEHSRQMNESARKEKRETTTSTAVAAESDETSIDPLLVGNAAVLISYTQYVSNKLLQDKLHIDNEEAEKLLGYMESQGLIGPDDGGKPRDVLINQDTIEETLARLVPGSQEAEREKKADAERNDIDIVLEQMREKHGDFFNEEVIKDIESSIENQVLPLLRSYERVHGKHMPQSESRLLRYRKYVEAIQQLVVTDDEKQDAELIAQSIQRQTWQNKQAAEAAKAKKTKS